ncbi:flagellar basal body rod C-terminal domain-containing protein [Phenylobacterium sp.]|jgi:flagellar hook protein FlgE|uniref:flagellar basal body rod C-terminal domain-containing protein n=1 Tax=Phenylobacterium sp. TaxID=1871053 RepID=UPI002F3E2776
MDPIAAARYGMMVAAKRFEGAADRIAGTDGASATDDTQAVTDMVQAKHQYVAQVQTLKVADEMWRALIDLQAGSHARP